MPKTKMVARGVPVGKSGGAVRDGKGMLDGSKVASGTSNKMPVRNTVGGHGSGLFNHPKRGK